MTEKKDIIPAEEMLKKITTCQSCGKVIPPATDDHIYGYRVQGNIHVASGGGLIGDNIQRAQQGPGDPPITGVKENVFCRNCLLKALYMKDLVEPIGDKAKLQKAVECLDKGYTLFKEATGINWDDAKYFYDGMRNRLLIKFAELQLPRIPREEREKPKDTTK